MQVDQLFKQETSLMIPGEEGYLELIDSQEKICEEQPIPSDLILIDSEMNSYDINQLAAEGYVVIFIYPGNGEGMNFGEAGMWGCTPESCEFRKWHDILQSARIVLFGMSLQKPEVQQSFKQYNELPFPILNGNEFVKKMGIPVWRVKQPHARADEQFPQRTTLILAEGVIKKIYPNVIISHADATEDALAHVAKVMSDLGMGIMPKPFG